MEIIFRVGVAILMLGEADLLCMDMEGMLMVRAAVAQWLDYTICAQ